MKSTFIPHLNIPIKRKAKTNIPLTKEEREEYFKAREKFEEENPGHYFRNNVWWWRPLANYVLQLMGNEFTEDEQASWHHNDGFEVSEEQARKIADRLEQELKTKRVKTVERFYKIRMKKAQEENKIVEQKHEELKKIVAEKTGKDNLVPRDYPEPFHTQWEDIQKEDVDIIQGMQIGRNSPVYNGGNFSPKMDNPTHHFHKWVAGNLI